jgi:hypothetical protein
MVIQVHPKLVAMVSPQSRSTTKIHKKIAFFGYERLFAPVTAITAQVCAV